LLEPAEDELELPDAPAPDVLPDAPALSPLPQSFAANCGSAGLRFAHFADLLFCPERVAAGVLLAFSCAWPELLMCCCALSRPVDLLVLPDFFAVDLLADPAVLDSLLLLAPVEVPVPDSDPEPPSLLVVPVVEPLMPLPAVPVLLVPLLLPLSEEPLDVPAVDAVPP
jgi:hypothetical protein